MSSRHALFIFCVSLISLVLPLSAVDPRTPEERQKAIDEAIITFYPIMLGALREGRLDAARELFQIAIEQQPTNSNNYYNLACVEARAGNQDKALIALRKSADLGFPKAEHVSEDSDMDTLRDHPTYKAILLQITKNGQNVLENQTKGKPFTFKAGGRTHTITLPGGWDWKETSDYEVPDKTRVRFLATTPANRNVCIIQHIPAGDSGQRLSAEKIHDEYMKYLVRAGEKNGTLKRGKVTLFGKPAYAVLADYQEQAQGVASPKNMVLKIVCSEPSQGGYYYLKLEISGPSILTEKTPQELANFLMSGE